MSPSLLSTSALLCTEAQLDSAQLDSIDSDQIERCRLLCDHENWEELATSKQGANTPFEIALSTWLGQKKTTRVGRYFEALIEFWLRIGLGYEIVTHQKQLFEDNRTVGEIDFLYHHPLKGLTHLETAVKFFLHFEGKHHSGSHFIGPNSRDNFEKKMTRLFEHQLIIGKKFFPEIQVSEAFVQGRIFYHPKTGEPDIIPDLMAKEHQKGSWIYEHELDWVNQFPDASRFRIARKPHWLSPEQADLNSIDLDSKDELIRLAKQHFASVVRPLLIVQMSPVGERYVEETRFFIVSRNWPHE